MCFDSGILQLNFQLAPNLFKAGGCHYPAVSQQDEMIAKLGLHWAGIGVWLHVENCIFKGFHHLTLTKPAQITTARAGGAS